MPDERLIPKMPAPLGYSAALDRMGTAAAPLLAGFAFTLIGLILTNSASVGHAQVALLLLMIAALLLIEAVQLAFRARRYYVPPEEYLALLEIADADEIPRERIRSQLAQWLPTHVRSLDWARLSYNAGIVLLLSGVAVALIPPGKLSHASDVRLAAAAVAVLGALAELIGGVVLAAIDAIQSRRADPSQSPPPDPPVPPSPATPAPPPAAPAQAQPPATAQATTNPPAPATATQPMPSWIFLIAVAWLASLVAMFVVYVTSSAARHALPATLGASIPVGVPWFGALGGCLISLTGIFDHNRAWDPSYNYWHALRPVVGAITGGIGCILLLITAQLATTGATKSDPTFYYGVAFVFGFGEAAFRSLITAVTNVLLKPGK